MKLKVDDNGHVVLSEEGLPVYVWEGGQEQGVDVPGLYDKLNDLNSEAKHHRLKANEVSEKLKAVEEAGIEDLPAWLAEAQKALQTVQNLKDKEMIDAGEVEKLKAGITQVFESQLADQKKGFETRIGELEQTVSGKDTAIRKLLVKGAFSASPFIKDKTVLTPDIAFSYFGHAFDVEENNGELRAVAKRRSGDKILSRVNPGELATPEEAIEVIVSEHPDKDRILKAGQPGSGSPGGTGTNLDGKITPEQVSKMTQEEYIKARREGKI